MRSLVVTQTSRPQPSIYWRDSEDGFLNWDTLIWRFAAEKSYWVNSMGQTPHAMPVWGIWHDSAFKFSTFPKSRKALNLKTTPYATVHLANTEAVFSMECDVDELCLVEDLQTFVDEYNPKYRWNFTIDDVAGGVFALTPYKAFAWAGGEGEAFSTTATKFLIAVNN